MTTVPIGISRKQCYYKLHVFLVTFLSLRLSKRHVTLSVSLLNAEDRLSAVVVIGGVVVALGASELESETLSALEAPVMFSGVE